MPDEDSRQRKLDPIDRSFLVWQVEGLLRYEQRALDNAVSFKDWKWVTQHHLVVTEWTRILDMIKGMPTLSIDDLEKESEDVR
jgi:hypothetical protein